MIEYTTEKFKIVGYSPENGQALTDGKVCTNPDCQAWLIGDPTVPIYPVLKKNEQGFRICPICHCSYGA